MDPIFGWGTETRFSWGPAKEMLEGKAAAVKAEWPADGEDDGMKMTDFYRGREQGDRSGNELADWYGTKVTAEVI